MNNNSNKYEYTVYNKSSAIYSTTENESGSGENCVVPDEVANKFNWGAFGLGFIWGIANKSYLTLFWLIGLKLPFSFIICLIMQIWFGKKGNTWAWQNKRWDSIEKFHEAQRKWAIAAIITMLAAIPVINITEKIISASEHTYKKQAKSMRLYDVEGIDYSFKKLPQRIVEFLKTNENYKDLYDGKKIVIYITGGDCPNRTVFEDSLESYKKHSDEEQYYHYNAKPSSGFIKVKNAKEARTIMKFDEMCNTFCIVNTKNNEIFSINGVGDNEARKISSILEQLKDW